MIDNGSRLTHANLRTRSRVSGLSLCLGIIAGLLSLFFGSAPLFACHEQPLYAIIERSLTSEPAWWDTADLEVCAGTVVYFRAVNNWYNLASDIDLDISSCDGSQLTDSVHYYWDFDYDGQTQSLENDYTQISHVFASPGEYVVRLLVTDEVLSPCHTDDNLPDHIDPYDSITVTVLDCTPPTTPVVNDGLNLPDIDVSASTTELSANWTACSDPESGLDHYEYAIGTSPGAADIIGWTSAGTNTSMTEDELSLSYGQVCFCSVKAFNADGYSIMATSDGVTIRSSRTIYVDSDILVPGDGLSWETAQATILAALNMSLPGDEIWIKAGVYPQDDELYPNGVSLYGGFAGGETSRDQRDWASNESVIEGTGYDTVIHPMDYLNSGLAVVIDGFTLRDGADGVSVGTQHGCTVSHNKISNVVFGVRCYASAVVSNNIIWHYTHTGIYCDDGTQNLITNNTIVDSVPPREDGAGIRLELGTESTVSYNITVDGYVGIDDHSTNSTILKNCAYGNVAAEYLPSTPEGNLVASPMFVDSANHDFHILYDSPCVDYTGVTEASGQKDIDGQDRLTGASVDVGADECQCEDSTGPAIGIVSPMGTNWHVAPSQSVVIKWTVEDADSGINADTVQIDTGVGWDSNVTYDSGSGTWSHTWQSPSSTTISIQATDNCGNTTTTSAGITVTTASVIYVDSTRPDDTGNGQTWATAKKTIQAGFNAAASGNDVWVAAGTYVECITHKSGVGLYGGFTGAETTREQRNWATNETVLDGNQSGPVVTVGSASATAIDGFTIRNGSSSRGGGIYIYSYYTYASVTIANNIIRANSAIYGGGGLSAFGNLSTLIVVGNVFVGNTAGSSGGGIYYENWSWPVVKIANNTIIGNSASDGGGIYLASSYTDLSLSNNIIAFNVGGGIYKYSGSPVFTKNDVYGNDSNGKYEYSWTTSYPVGTDLVPADPVIPNIDSGDWHIAGTSPCHDPEGTTLLVPIDRDIDVGSRVYGSTVDIGADEWSGTDPTPVTPSVIYVKPSSEGGSDSNNGTTWTSAVATVQKGIDLAYSAGNCEVWVAAGTYQKSGSATTVANMKSFVKLYGGFAVGDASKSARDWKTNQTILDGGASGAVVMISSAVGSTVDGFVIRNGNGYYSSSSYRGGGIYCSNASATIVNNIIRGNTAGSSGGGLYATASNLTVAGNVLVGNKAHSGGGIHFFNTNGQIANNTIIDNVASSDGGGVLMSSSSVTLSNNIIFSNLGGGIYKYSGSPTFVKNDVYGNSGNGKYEYSWTTTYPVGTDLVPADPVITNIDWGDWHIASTSPCHDPIGTTLAVSLDKDIDVESRVYGSTVDIGADEWNGTDPTPVTPSVIYVKPSSEGGSDSNNGTTWTLAVATVQKGIDIAYAAGGGEVWVAAGSYQKSESATTVANMKSFVKVFGGFAVGDASKSARDWKTNQTVLDGNASVAVVTASSAVGCTVDGFVIKNGSASNGSGISCTNASATIVNNIIRGNTASSYGGGLYATASNLTVAGNVFVDNKASTGGGIYYTTSYGQIANNTVIDNAASSDCGGVYLYSGSPALSNNIVGFNGGGGIYKYSGSPTFVKNDVYGNGKYEYSWTTTYPVGTDLVPVDPGIPDIGWGDWHITSTSPCHDPTGTTLAVSLDKDIDVESRVYGSTVDIGADEWSGTDPTPVTPSVIYVKPSSEGGSDSNNGTSWITAVATVQKGIDLAYAAGGAEVWVATGTYTVVTGQTYVANFKSFAHVFGGFAVGDASKSARDWKTNQTVLDGNARGAVVMISSAVGSIVDGFVIRNGNGYYSGYEYCGGGIYCSNASATIVNNIIRGNTASSSGGGLYATASNLTVAGNVFVDNKANSGGGIYYTNTSGQIANNTIICNAASSDGGGIYLTSSSPSISNNIVAANGGGGIYKSGGTPTFTKNDVYGNGGDAYSWKTWTQGDPEIGTDLAPVDPGIPNIGWGGWHIASNSPCHDPTGTALAVSLDKDIDTETRVYGTTVDIGADEWSGTDPTPVNPSVIYVKPSSEGGSDSNNGTSWITAVATVQKGIDLAYAAGGAEVWVAAGTYAVVTGQTYVANFKSFAYVFGGFAVGDASKSARDWKTNQTVLSGSPYGAVITMSSVTACQIDGFTVQNGARGFSLSYAVGTISHNTIKGNGPSVNDGVGIYNYRSFSVIANNIIADNTACEHYYGGGVYLYNSDARIINNTITQNSASTAGGLYIYGGTPTIINNIVTSNSSGIYLTGGTGIVPAYNDIWNNTGDIFPNYWKPATTENGPPDTNGNIIKDPKFLDAAHLDFHIPWGSGCRDAGLNSVALPDDLDIDEQARRNGTIDIGADETTECCQYALILDPATQKIPEGSSATVSTSVLDAATNQPVTDYQVDFVIDAGEIVSVKRSGTVVNLPSGTQSTYGVTDASGETEIVVTNQEECYVHVTGAITQCAQPDSKTVGIWFYTVEEADWPMFMHDPQHTAKSQVADTTSETLTLAWSAEVQTATTSRSQTWSYHNQPGGYAAGYIFTHPYIDSSPVVVGNTVVVGTWTRGTDYANATGSVVAFNAETGGNSLWTATGTPSMGGVASTPCIYNDNGTYKVYVGTTNGYLYCLNLTTGAQLWAQPTTDRSSPAVQSKIIASPVIHDGIVYVGNEAAKVYAFDAATGTLQQGYPVTLPIEGHLYTQPPTLQTENMTGVSSAAVACIADTDYLLFGCDDGYVYRFTLGTSDPQSTLVGVNLGYCVESSPTVIGDKAYIGISRYNGYECCGLSIEPLQILALTQIGEECRATLAYDFNGYLYVGVDTGNTFHKLNSGRLQNAASFGEDVLFPTDYFVGSAAVCGNGLVYIGNDGGTFRALTLSSLSQSASYGAGAGYICSSPAIAYNVDANHNRWVYVTTRNTNGKLLAFKTVR